MGRQPGMAHPLGGGGTTWDYCDHVASVKNIYLGTFYDVGDAYVEGHSIGSVAHALGMGLRVDVAWFSLIERTTLARTLPKPWTA